MDIEAEVHLLKEEALENGKKLQEQIDLLAKGIGVLDERQGAILAGINSAMELIEKDMINLIRRIEALEKRSPLIQ